MSEEEIREEQEHREETPEGFISKERWEEMGRDPDDWRDPEEFKEKGEQINSVLKKQRDELKGEIDSFRKDFDQYRQHQHQLTQQKEKEAYERARREYDSQLKQIREVKAKAIEDMDGEQFTQAEDMEKRLTPPQEPIPQQQQQRPQLHPDVAEFISRPENAWYNEDKGLREYADYLATKNLDQVRMGSMTVKEALKSVSEQVKEQFPQKFGKGRVPSVESGSTTTRSKGKSFRDLPAEAKEACDRFIKRGVKITREQYAKEYFGE